MTSDASSSRSPARRHVPAALALLALAVWLLATAGLRPLLLPDEGRYAGVARDMLLGVGHAPGAGTLGEGRGWVPLLNGLPFFHKPPLMYWLDMAAMALFGVNQLSARFAPFVGAWVMGAALFLALRRWHGPAVAQRALLVLASCPFFFVGAQYANLDMLVAGLITATVLAFVRAVDGVDQRGGPAPPLPWLLAAWALAALSVLAKGLIGIVLPLAVVCPWLLAQRRWRDVLRLLHPAGLALFAVLALPWMLAMQWRYPGFLDYFIVEQHFRRFAQSGFNNAHPAWFYVAVLPALTLPWALWLPAALQRLRRESLLEVMAVATPSGRSSARWHLALYVWWVIAIVAFFSLPSSKLVGYVLPALAPWCVLLSLGVARFGRAARATLTASALLSVAVVVVLTWKAPHSSKLAARVLAAQWVPGDRVVFVDEMFFDLPLYAGLREPPIVASDWADPELPRHDNWRKELADAARFDPARGRELLFPIRRLAELACHTQAVWFVLPAATPVAALAGVEGLREVHADAEVRLLRAPGRTCAAP